MSYHSELHAQLGVVDEDDIDFADDDATDEELLAIQEETEDDDPRCVCGVYRSEHSLCGCPEGFQSLSSWKEEKAFIISLDSDEYDRIYHPYD